MASVKTKSTELGLCFGVLGIPISEDEKKRMVRVENVDTEIINELLAYYNKDRNNQSLINDMWQVGNAISPTIRKRINVTPESTNWSSNQQQSTSTIVGRDIVFNDLLSVSVKAKSNIISNRAPRALIEELPSGTVTTSRGKNWYYEVAPEEYQHFYSLYHPSRFGLPNEASEYDSIPGSKKKEFKEFIKKNFSSNTKHHKSYIKMCNRVMIESAKRFEENMKTLLETPGSSPMLKRFCEHFFRINSSPYILAGIDGNLKGKPGGKFAVEIPSATEWNSQYLIKNIMARPNIGSGQPVVSILVRLASRSNPTLYEFSFHMEIRWSHGKFGGSPEGKLYKGFLYNELPWAKNILA